METLLAVNGIIRRLLSYFFEADFSITCMSKIIMFINYLYITRNLTIVDTF